MSTVPLSAGSPAGSATLGTVFKASLYLLTALASLALGIGDERIFPVLFTPAMCLAAWLLSESWPVVRLSAQWGNALAILALVITGVEFWPQELLGRLLAGAHLLVYLTWIVLFQEKRVTQYWLLLALGLLMVAVGAVLTISGWFGLLLVLYMVLAIWTVSVFTLYQGEMRFAGEARRGTQLIEGSERRSLVTNAVQLDPAERWLSLRFIAGILGVAFGGLLLGVAFFLLVPRMWVGGLNVLANDSGGPLGGRTLTGFSPEVTLADMGTILDSSDIVLEIRATRYQNGQPADLYKWAEAFGQEDLRFRGAVFDSYERDAGNRGRWHAESAARHPNISTTAGHEGYVKLEVGQEAIGTDIVFPLWPLNHANYSSRKLQFRRTVSDVLMVEDRPASAIVYNIFLPETPEVAKVPPPGLSALPNSRRPGYLQVPEDGLDRLRALAADVVRSLGSADLRDFEKTRKAALALESHLKLSGKYQYTRETRPKDPGIDPIEDFLFNRKAGHCQYYAAALTLMLRSVGIPARMVNGFKGAESNSPGAYTVQQRHAHSWVEAWLDNPDDRARRGQWLVLDPTPAARDEAVAESLNAQPTLWGQTRESMNAFWSTYVVGLSMERQQQSFFEPLQNLVAGVGQVFSEKSGMDLPRWAWLLVTNPQMWFTWQGALTAGTLLGLVWGGYFGLRSLARRVAGISWKARRGGQSMRVEFYERLAKLLARRGLARQEDQTAREFSTLATRVLHPELAPAGLQGIPSRLVEAFYQVRYGEAVLTPDELALLNGDLDRLEACLTPSDRGK